MRGVAAYHPSVGRGPGYPPQGRVHPRRYELTLTYAQRGQTGSKFGYVSRRAAS